MKRLTYILGLVLAFTACTDLDSKYSDAIPFDKFPDNDEQLAIMPTPAYSYMREFLDNAGWWFCQEVTSDETCCPTRGTDWDDGGKWRVLYQHEWTNNTEAINSMWSRYYGGISEANRIKEFFETLETSDATLSSIAKMRVLCDYYHYLAMDNYGNVPYVTEFANAEEFPTKTPRATIFQNLVDDITDCIPNIAASSSKTAVTKAMAFCLLAKLYINAEVYTGTAQWAKAEAAIDSVLAMGYSLEGDCVAPFVTNNTSSTENIFVIPYDEDTYQGFNLHMRTLHYNHNLTYDMAAAPWNGFAATYSHYNTYENGDARKEAYFIVGQQYTSAGAEITDAVANSKLIINPYIPALTMSINNANSNEEIRMSGARVQKFEIKKGAKENLSNDFPIFRLADFILMKAEVMIRQGNNGDSYINQIRNRAGLGNITNATLDDVLAERGRELFWEAHRRQDLIRFGKFLSARWEKTASSADRITFPIPQWAIDANPNLAN